MWEIIDLWGQKKGKRSGFGHQSFRLQESQQIVNLGLRAGDFAQSAAQFLQQGTGAFLGRCLAAIFI